MGRECSLCEHLCSVIWFSVTCLLQWVSACMWERGSLSDSAYYVGDWHCHECRAARKAAAQAHKHATSTEAVLSEPELEPMTAAKPARRSAVRLASPLHSGAVTCNCFPSSNANRTPLYAVSWLLQHALALDTAFFHVSGHVGVHDSYLRLCVPVSAGVPDLAVSHKRGPQRRPQSQSA